MHDSTYLDTSALAKWYLNESNTEKVSEYIVSLDRAIISSLTITEMRCLLARHKRMRHFSDKVEQQLYASFLNDMDQGHLIVEPFSENYFMAASHLIASLPMVPLRTLDALHLSIIQGAHINILATADEVMAKAAKKIGLTVKKF